jgi:retinol dehydrogenase-12
MPHQKSISARKLAVVSGANTGIGFEVARGLAKSGVDVVLACRDKTRGQDAIQAIAKEFPSPTLELLLIDLASQQSVRAAASSFVKKHPTLDVLVNNAGIGVHTREASPDGIELTFATNVLGYFLLTELLLETLRKTPAARVVNVASKLAGGLDLNDLEFKHRQYDATTAYSQSKQANRMLTWALARRLERSLVTANAMSPGAVNTRLLQSFVPGRVGKTTVEGADTVVWLAVSEEVDGLTGRFWTDRKEEPCQFRNLKEEEDLWRVCEDMTGPNGSQN